MNKECCTHTNCFVSKENLKHPQKYNQAYFKPSQGLFEPEQPPQNAQKSQNPEYDVFASHN